MWLPRTQDSYSTMSSRNLARLECLGLLELRYQLIALHEARKAAFRARRQSTNPLTPDEDVRQRALTEHLAQLHTSRRALVAKRKPLQSEFDILEVAARRLDY